MTAITIDKDQAIELLEKQVEKFGEDYIYPYASCVYFAEEDTADDRDYEPVEVECGTPLCIVGNVYADLGLTAEDLRFTSWYGEGVEGSQDGAVGENLPDPEKVILTEGAQAVLRAAQSIQDQYQTWGAAFAEAKATAKVVVA